MSVPELSIVIPCYNEEDVIEACHQQLSTVLQQHVPNYQVVYVNDGSQDRTMELLLQLQAHDPRIRIVDLSRNFGQQPALSAGIEHATGASVGIMDADLQDPPEVMVKMYDVLIAEDWDVVYGVRLRRQGETKFKRVTANVFYRIMNKLADVPIPRNVGEFRIMNGRAKNALLSLREHHRMLRGMASWIGFRQRGFEYERPSRFAGVSKYPLHKMIELALDGFFSFSSIPIRWVSYFGFTVAGMAALAFAVEVALRLAGHGYTGLILTFLGLSFLGGFQILTLGIVGEYIARIYTEAKGRPIYLVRQVFDRE